MCSGEDTLLSQGFFPQQTVREPWKNGCDWLASHSRGGGSCNTPDCTTSPPNQGKLQHNSLPVKVYNSKQIITKQRVSKCNYKIGKGVLQMMITKVLNWPTFLFESLFRILEQQGIHCNMTLLFSFAQVTIVTNLFIYSVYKVHNNNINQTTSQ